MGCQGDVILMRLFQRTVFYLLISYLRKRSTQKLENCRDTHICIILLSFAYKNYFLNFKLIFLSFASSHIMDVRVRLQRKLSARELMLLNCGVGEDS